MMLTKFDILISLLSTLWICGVFSQHDHPPGGHQGSNQNKLITDMYTNCKTEKSNCAGVPIDCIADKKCDYMVEISPDSGNKKYRFSMFLSHPQGNSYVAVGIAKDGKNMLNTSIISCTPSHVNVFWSEGAQPPQLVTDDKYVNVDMSSRGDAELFCVFDVNASFEEHGIKFDLTKEKYAILLAKGVFEGGDQYIQYHSGKQRVEPVRLANSSKALQQPKFMTILMLFMITLVSKF